MATKGLYLPQPIFSHGQLYVASSRVTSMKDLKVLTIDDEDIVMNVVVGSVNLLKGTHSSCSPFHNDGVAAFMVATLCVCVTYGWWLFLASDPWLCPDLHFSRLVGCCHCAIGSIAQRLVTDESSGCGFFAWGLLVCECVCVSGRLIRHSIVSEFFWKNDEDTDGVDECDVEDDEQD
ncbi:transmembrane protein, putative [Medicago truncatula]|uniref:Transmembrane protein, putative n=1 Tax=Medicago truncatula TaxID=3880 RepID=A0A072UTN4_MEDTR|nr:transmembrane protein, putative [Medicago truncatula]